MSQGMGTRQATSENYGTSPKAIAEIGAISTAIKISS